MPLSSSLPKPRVGSELLRHLDSNTRPSTDRPDDGDVNSIDMDNLSVQESKRSRGSEESSDVAMGDAAASVEADGMKKTDGVASGSPVLSDSVPSGGEKSTGEDWIRQLDENVEENNRTDHDMDPAESPYFPNPLWRHPGPAGPCWCGGADRRSHLPGGPRYSLDARKHSDHDRSIIDDLTVENKELRRKLRRYEAPSTRHLNQERLFEVTAYDSLTPDEYLQLHELLQRFAMGKSISMSKDAGSSSKDKAGPYGRNNDDSSEQINDSAYTSGGGSKTGSADPLSAQGLRRPSALHDLRSSTLSSRSERARMKSVVKKLEEVFTGRASSSDNNAQHVQHQLQSADGDDRQDSLYSSHEIEQEEGAREAAISSDTKHLEQSNDSSESLVPDNAVPDQRPTHPTDLDPDRGQNKEQNMEYLHHLTALSPAAAGGGIDMQGRWVFLNLVTNMAQLHSMSVSKAFVNKAIKTFSRNLELSKDGQMIRWRGGGSTGSSQGGENGEGDVRMFEASSEDSREDLQTKKMSSSGDVSLNVGSSSQPGSGSGSGSAPGASASKDSSGGMYSNGQSGSGNSGNSSSFHYQPLFAKQESESESSSLSWVTDSVRGNVSSDDWAYGDGGFTGRGGNRKRMRIGPRVYYRDLPFCTDLATTPSLSAEASPSPFNAERYTAQPLGLPLEIPNRPPTHTREILSHVEEEDEDEDEDIESDSENVSLSRCSSRLTIYPSSPISPPSTVPSPIPLTASGLGPTILTDNFATFTKTRYFFGDPPKPPVHISSTTTSLEPSAYPPAVYLPDSDDEDDDISLDDSTEMDAFADSSSEGNLAVMDEDSEVGFGGESYPISPNLSGRNGLSSPGEEEAAAMNIGRTSAPYLGTIRMNVESD